MRIGTTMGFEDFLAYDRFRQAWDSVRIARPVRYTLFTFGDTDLPYFLVCEPTKENALVSIRKGNVTVAKPVIYMPNNAPPEFQNFFEGAEDEDLVRFLLARTAQFRNMKFENLVGSEELVSDSVDEAIARLNRKLDDDEEDRVAVLAAPAGLSSVAVLRYCLERVAESVPDNLTELREKGILP